MALSPEARQEFVQLLNQREQKLAWPYQFLHVWYALLLKMDPTTAGEERPIGLLPFPIRLWGKIRKMPLSQWCEQNGGEQFPETCSEFW